MFLEETIGSLDAEGDSGVSTDDADYGEPSKPRKGAVPRGKLEAPVQPGCAKGTPLAGRGGAVPQLDTAQVVPTTLQQPHGPGTTRALPLLTGGCGAKPAEPWGRASVLVL